MRFIPYTWIKICSLRTDFKKISSFATVLVLSFLLFPILSPACVVTCKSNLNVSLDGSGQAVITPLILLQDHSCDATNFSVDIADPNGNSVGNTLTCDHVGLTMIATVTEINTGNYCSTSISVVDYIKPQIMCVDTVVLCNQSVDPSVIGYPLATDNCTVFANTDLVYNDEFMDLACFAVQGTDTLTSQIQRTWSVQDESGNVNTCIQMIYLKRVTIDDVTFPAHLNGFAAPALNCSQDPTDLSLTGKPSINGINIDNSGNCELVISHTDQEIPLCGTNGIRILRTWTVIDYCSGDFILSVQIINIEDNTAPEIICPADLTIGTLQNDCSATINFPTTTATDDCSDFTVVPSWEFGTGYGPFFDIPLGTHLVTYTATDDCGNVSTCTMNVTVIDNIPPTPVCDYNTAVNLSVFGTAIVYANTFDDGSHDNCGIENIAVSRDGINFGPSVSFDCNDIDNSPVEVLLRIWDTAGNYNECTVNTIVGDNIPPAISCPATVNLNCQEDYNDLNLVGAPIVADNCTIDTLYYSDVLNLNVCNEGSITRTWTVEDVKGNTSTCMQLITLQDNTPLSITWPVDYVSSICNANTTTAVTGEPQLINNDCESISVTHSDNVFETSPSCYRILRTWEIYEWCTYNAENNSNEGYWSHLQIIDIEDNTAPGLSCAPDTIIGMYAANCSGVNVTLEVPVVSDCNPNVTITNDSPYAINNGGDASGFYPAGSHTITYTASDGCGNYTLCSRTITVVDAKLPTPVCFAGLNFTIGNNGEVNITADMVNNGSFDNCTATENLIMEVNPMVFTCDDLGAQTVTLTVTDEMGNSAFCTSVITIQDNANICTNPNAKIAGYIHNENGTPVEWVDIVLSGGAQDTVHNNEMGYFELPEVAKGEDYEVTPVKDIFYMNGISTFDLVHMQRHILGIQQINSPYKMIAGDVNKSGSISTIDMVRLRKLILQQDTVFTGNDSWRFVNESYVFPDPTNPFMEQFPESLLINNLSEDILDANFIALKVGDVSGNANASQLIGEADDRSMDALTLKTTAIDFEKGEIVEIPVFAEDFDKILGYQFTFDFDVEALTFVSVEGGSLENMNDENFNFSKLEDGYLTTSWTRGMTEILDTKAPLIVLKFRSKEKGNLKNNFSIGSELLNAEAYSEEMEILGINFEFSEVQENKREQFMLYQNYPNPFVGSTTIPFTLPKAGNIRFEAIDSKGTLVFGFEKEFDAGHQEIILNRSDFGSSGIYFFRLTNLNGDQQTISLMVK